MKRALAAKMGFAVLLWFLAAPFFHLHAADTGDSHRHQVTGHDQDAIVHFHLPGPHPSGRGVTVSSSGEDEKPVDSNAVVQARTALGGLPFLALRHVESPAPVLNPARGLVIAFTPQAHDPPESRTAQPRAPPFSHA
jgi:hypothetical protein